MREKRFRDTSLTIDQAYEIVAERSRTRRMPYDPMHRQSVEERAASLLLLWRQWGIERERLWFAILGLGLDTEIDHTIPMTRKEMYERLVSAALQGSIARRVQIGMILRKIDSK